MRNGERFDEDIRIDRMEGVRRSDMIRPREREQTEIRERRYVGGRPVEEKLWTEITKDLVVREALEGCGYEIEETEHFYYVMEYLGYVSPTKELTKLLVANSLCSATSIDLSKSAMIFVATAKNASARWNGSNAIPLVRPYRLLLQFPRSHKGHGTRRELSREKSSFLGRPSR